MGKNLIEWRLNDSILKLEGDTKKYEFLDNSNTLLLVKNLSIHQSGEVYTCEFKLENHLIKKSIFNFLVGSKL